MRRVFVASPGDVSAERRIAERVVAEFRTRATVNSYVWESIENKLVSNSFIQQQIARPGDKREHFSAVIAILGERLGTPLPPSFPIPPSMRDFVERHNRDFPNHPIQLPGDTQPGIPLTGTLFEILDTLSVAGTDGAPDLFLFVRNPSWESKANLDSVATPSFAGDPSAQHAAVNLLLSTLFKGRLIRPFKTPRQFEHMLRAVFETTLIDRTWSVEELCRGLQPFDIRHARIFFGRDGEVRDTLADLANAHSGTSAAAPFLLLEGLSGAGKSSFVRAGLLGHLTQEPVNLERQLGVKFEIVDIPIKTLDGSLFDEIAMRLGSVFGAALSPDSLSRCRAVESAQTIADLFTQAVADRGETGNLLPIVLADQFEETLQSGRREDILDRRLAIELLALLSARRLAWAIVTLSDDEDQKAVQASQQWGREVGSHLDSAGIKLLTKRLSTINDIGAILEIFVQTAGKLGVGVSSSARSLLVDKLDRFLREFEGARGLLPLLSLYFDEILKSYDARIGEGLEGDSSAFIEPADICEPRNLIEYIGEAAFTEIEEATGGWRSATKALEDLVRRFFSAAERRDETGAHINLQLRTASLTGMEEESDAVVACKILRKHRLMQRAGARSLRFVHFSISDLWPRMKVVRDRVREEIVENLRFRLHDPSGAAPGLGTLVKWSRLYRKRGLEGSVLDTDAHRKRNDWLRDMMLIAAGEESDPQIYAQFISAAIQGRDEELAFNLLKAAEKDNPRERSIARRMKDPSDPLEVFQALDPADKSASPLVLQAARARMPRTVSYFRKRTKLFVFPDQTGESLLHVAAATGDARSLSWAIEAASRIENKKKPRLRRIDRTNATGMTPLMMAARNGHPAALKALLDAGAKIDQRLEAPGKFHHKSQAIHFACMVDGENGRACVDLLSERGADLGSLNAANATPLHYATDRGSTTVAARLLKQPDEAIRAQLTTGALLVEDSIGDPPIVRAIRRQALDVLDLLIGEHTRLGIPLGESIRICSGYGYLMPLKALLSASEKLEVTRDTNGRTALHLAAQYGHEECLRCLVEHPVFAALVDDLDEFDRRPLHYASFFGRAGAAGALLQADANPALPDAEGTLPIVIASRKRNYLTVDAITAHSSDAALGAEPFRTLVELGDEGQLFYRYKDSDKAEFLRSRSRDQRPIVNIIAYKGLNRIFRRLGLTYSELEPQEWRQLLYDAVAGDQLHAVAMVLANLTPQERQDACGQRDPKYGKTALHFAAEYGNIEAVRELLDWSAWDDLTSDGRFAGHLAAFAGHLDVVKLIYAAVGQPSLEDIGGWGTICHSAAAGSALSVIDWCESVGLDLDAGDGIGRTALSIAARDGSSMSVARLLEHGANPDIPDRNGLTPLHEAVNQNDPDSEALLLAYQSPLKTSPSEASQAILQGELSTAARKRLKSESKAARQLAQSEILARKKCEYEQVVGPYKLAVRGINRRNMGTLRKAIRQGAEPYSLQHGPSLIHLAIDAGWFKGAWALSRVPVKPEWTRRYGNGRSLLHLCVLKDRPDMVQRCLRRGIPITSRDDLGRSALDLAVASLKVEMVSRLLSFRTPVVSKFRNRYGRTPLHTVARFGVPTDTGAEFRLREIARQLLAAGFDMEQPDEFGETPGDIFRTRSGGEMIDFYTKDHQERSGNRMPRRSLASPLLALAILVILAWICLTVFPSQADRLFRAILEALAGAAYTTSDS